MLYVNRVIVTGCSHFESVMRVEHRHAADISGARVLHVLVLLCVSTLALSACARESRGGGRSAQDMQERLWAPCCWTQTLDAHESELASTLRTEIDHRLQRGESSAAIEDDLAARYGARIRAVPRGKDPRGIIPAVVGLGMMTTLFGLIFLVRRRKQYAPNERASLRDNTQPRTAPLSMSYEEKLNEELARLDDA